MFLCDNDIITSLEGQGRNKVPHSTYGIPRGYDSGDFRVRWRRQPGEGGGV
ncbi:MAG: hypothetical protein JW726_19775 [Anaerolineales bacterium]|nr:hypothetical protein [Anaerolineales bacterium]